MEIRKNKNYIVGILNVTPDSFSDGGEHNKLNSAVCHAKKMLEGGANVIDIGGESTRPGADNVPVGEEINRVLPVVKKLKSEIGDITISVDTRKPKVAEVCLQEGAGIINDVSGLREDQMIEVISKHNAAAIIMHMQGTPESMQKNPEYSDVVKDVKEYLAQQAKKAKQGGIEHIIVDPGIGFGKTLDHNLSLLNHIEEIVNLGYPVMLGASRKSFIGMISDTETKKRIPGTIASNILAQSKGVNLFRVHDVKECKQAMDVASSILTKKD